MEKDAGGSATAPWQGAQSEPVHAAIAETQGAPEAGSTRGTPATHHHGPPPEMVCPGAREVLSRHEPASHHCIRAPADMQEARQTEDAVPATV